MNSIRCPVNVIAADPIDFVNLSWTVVAIVDPMVAAIVIDLDSIAAVAAILYICMNVIDQNTETFLGSVYFMLEYSNSLT